MLGTLVLFASIIGLGYAIYWCIFKYVPSDEDYEFNPQTVRDRSGTWTDDDHPEDPFDDHSEQSSTQLFDPSAGNTLRSQTAVMQSPTSKFDSTDSEFRWQSNTGVTFEDVGGMDSLKQELYIEVIKPLEQKERAEELGVSAPNIVLYGPPGTGKTHIAEALASELSLPFAQLSGADLQSKWINESAEKVNQLFREAREIAQRQGGAVIFLDELDSVLKDRSAGPSAHEEDMKVVNEFLNHLERTKDNDVIFIGATNRVDALDEAGIRSGRIDKKIHIGKPDVNDREAILRTHLTDRNHNLSAEQVRSLAAQTNGFVPADLALAVENAAKRVLARDAKQIQAGDLYQGLQSVTEESQR